MQHTKSRTLAAALVAAAMTPLARPALAGTLNGSHSSMVHQHAVAVKLDYSFVRTAAQVNALVADSALERVTPNADLELSGVSFPYARPAVHDFIERLAAEYHAATGSPLVVTSLTRPTTLQPRNASPLSVHPAGMAVDLRIPAEGEALEWLEHELLSLEQSGVIDVTREHRPPHLHVAVFPLQYAEYAAQRPPVPASSAASPAAPIPLRAPTVAMAAANKDGRPSLAALAGGSAGVLLLVAAAIGTVLMRTSRQRR